MPHVKTKCLVQTAELIEEKRREEKRERERERERERMIFCSYSIFERATKVGVKKFWLSELNILITRGFFEAFFFLVLTFEAVFK